MPGEDLIDFPAVKRRSVVAFEEQGCAVIFESGFEERRDLCSVFDRADERVDAIARGEVMERDDFPAVVIGGVNGPGQVGPEPMNAFHGLNFLLSHLPGEHLYPAPGDTLHKLPMKGSGAGGTEPAVGKLLKLTEKLRAQRLALSGPGRLHRRLSRTESLFPTHQTGVWHLRAEFSPTQLQRLSGLFKLGNDRRYHLEFFFVEEPRTLRDSSIDLIIWRSFSFC